MLRFGVPVVLLLAATALATGATQPSLRTATAACPARVFTVAFDPKRQVVVSAGERVLASASFTTRRLSSRCRRQAQPKSFVDGGLGFAIRAPITFRCLTTKAIRIHVNPIRNGSTKAIVGSALVVGVGSPFRVIVSAVLKNKGDPLASRVYRAATYCKLGA